MTNGRAVRPGPPSPSSDLRHRLREHLGALRQITGSQRLERTIAVRSGTAIGVTAVAVLGKVIEDGPLRMSDLADAVRMLPAALTRQVQALEVEGLVERFADPNDGRASVVAATAAGRSVRRRVESARDEIMVEQLSEWTDEDLSTLVVALDRLVTDLRAVPASRRSRAAG